MNTFYVLSNPQKDPAMEMAGFIKEYLESQGKICYIQEKESNAHMTHYKYTDARKIPKDTECVLVLGGDGTLLQAARDLVALQLPLLGVNMGTLGFLAEVEHGNIRPALDKLIADDFFIENRMMLDGRARHQGRTLLSDIALNDIVIRRNGRLRMVEFRVFVDNVFLTAYTADGIIISTPTGSTGYNLSIGGPIVAPQASLMVMTAIAPHTLTSRPIILPENVEIKIEVSSASPDQPDGAEAIYDGDTSVKLNAGDQIIIKKSGQQARLIRMNNASFLEIPRSKIN